MGLGVRVRLGVRGGRVELGVRRVARHGVLVEGDVGALKHRLHTRACFGLG